MLSPDSSVGECPVALSQHRSLRDLDPALVWEHFDRIRQVPRASCHEEKVRGLVESWARDKRFPMRSDAYGNVVIDVPAKPGHEAAPVLVLQAHLDMVCEKAPACSFDFSKDAIQAEVAGEWVVAAETTLGADDGIGVAA